MTAPTTPTETPMTTPAGAEMEPTATQGRRHALTALAGVVVGAVLAVTITMAVTPEDDDTLAHQWGYYDELAVEVTAPMRATDPAGDGLRSGDELTPPEITGWLADSDAVRSDGPREWWGWLTYTTIDDDGSDRTYSTYPYAGYPGYPGYVCRSAAPVEPGGHAPCEWPSRTHTIPDGVKGHVVDVEVRLAPIEPGETPDDYGHIYIDVEADEGGTLLPERRRR